MAPDGRIYVLTQEIGQDDITQYPHLKAPRIDDYVAVLSPDGKELKKVRLIDELLRSPYARLLDTVPWYIQKGAGDYLHTNSIEYLDGTTAAKLPEATAGRLLLSFREIGTIAHLRSGAATRWSGRPAARGCASTTRTCSPTATSCCSTIRAMSAPAESRG